MFRFFVSFLIIFLLYSWEKSNNKDQNIEKFHIALQNLNSFLIVNFHSSQFFDLRLKLVNHRFSENYFLHIIFTKSHSLFSKSLKHLFLKCFFMYILTVRSQLIILLTKEIYFKNQLLFNFFSKSQIVNFPLSEIS